MTDAVDRILDKVLIAEGGYQDNPKDDGNWYKGQNLGTKYGITPEVLAKFWGKPVTKKDMQGLSEVTARKIYRKQYVEPIIRNMKPDPSVLPQLVDIHINHGYGNLKVILQRAAGAKVDGQMGPGTLKAMQSLTPEQLNNSLVDERKKFYQAIVKSKPEKQVFLKGWLNRAEGYRPQTGP